MSRRSKHGSKTPVVHDHHAAAVAAFWRRVAIVCAYAGLALSLAHAFTTPVLSTGSFINAPDEAAHLGYLRVIFERGHLPVPADRDMTYEWHQPPLAYALALPADAADPRAARVWGAILAALALVPIYYAARILFPTDPATAGFAVALVALLPMRQAIGGAVSNDALIELAFSGSLLLMLHALKHGLTVGRAVALGLAIAAAILTKLSGLLLVPLLLLTAIMARKRSPGTAGTVRNAAIALAVMALCTGWWFARNRTLYGEWMPVRVFANEFAGTSKATDWIGQPTADDLWTGAIRPAAEPMSRMRYLMLVKNWTWRTFTAAYTTPAGSVIGKPRFLPPTFYVPYFALALAALVGLLLALARRWRGMEAVRRQGVVLLVCAYGLVAASFTGFVWTWFQAQGRYLYPALLPLSVLCAYGFRAILPERWRDRATLGAIGLLFVLAAAFYLTAIQPAYS